jgi:hypothetical protein
MVPGNDLSTANRMAITSKGRRFSHCSICTSAIWFWPIEVKEPASVPEPRTTWTLCKSCHQALLVELRRSPIRSPLRLRITMGLVASERSPRAYSSTTHVRDQRLFIAIAWILFIFMLLHLGLIVFLASIAK